MQSDYSMQSGVRRGSMREEKKREREEMEKMFHEVTEHTVV